MKKLLIISCLLLIAFASCQNSPQNNAAYYLKEANKQLEAGNCEAAQTAYENYTQMSDQQQPELKDAIDECLFDQMIEELERLGSQQTEIDYIPSVEEMLRNEEIIRNEAK